MPQASHQERLLRQQVAQKQSTPGAGHTEIVQGDRAPLQQHFSARTHAKDRSAPDPQSSHFLPDPFHSSVNQRSRRGLLLVEKARDGYL